MKIINILPEKNRSLALPPLLGSCLLTTALTLHPCLTYAVGISMFISTNCGKSPKALKIIESQNG